MSTFRTENKLKLGRGGSVVGYGTFRSESRGLESDSSHRLRVDVKEDVDPKNKKNGKNAFWKKIKTVKIRLIKNDFHKLTKLFKSTKKNSPVK